MSKIDQPSDDPTPSFEIRAQRMRAVFLETDELTQAAALRAEFRRKRRPMTAGRGPWRGVLSLVFALLFSGGALAWNGDRIAEWWAQRESTSDLEIKDADLDPEPVPSTPSPSSSPAHEPRLAVSEGTPSLAESPPTRPAEGDRPKGKPLTTRSPSIEKSTEQVGWQRVAVALGQDDVAQAQAEVDRLRASTTGGARDAAILLSAQLEMRAKGAISAQTRRDLQVLAREGRREHIRREATRLLGD